MSDPATPAVDPAAPATLLGGAKAPDPVVPAADPAADPAKPAADPAKPDPAAEPAKPVEYKFTAPEGITLDDTTTKEFTDLATKLKLDPAVAQELVDYYGSKAKALSANAGAKAWTDLQAQWTKELSSDPELGGDKAVEAQTILGRALDEYGSPEARKAFDVTGAGNNPAIVRMFHKMAKLLSEGGPVSIGGPGGQKPNTLGGRLYPEKN